ncbi:MAG: thioredoxin fold domain-containing protein [Balneolaceae bacterium]|jgi:thioredoxin-related protein
MTIALVIVFVMGPTVSMAQSIKWMPLQQAQKLALQNHKKVMLFAEADWCGYCKRMHKEVFPQKTVQDSLYKYFYPARVDIESDQKILFNGKELAQRSLSQKFRIKGTPTTIFLDSNGDILGTQPGFLRSEIFDKLLSYVGAERYKKGSFRKYLRKHGIKVGE